MNMAEPESVENGVTESVHHFITPTVQGRKTKQKGNSVNTTKESPTTWCF